MRMPTRRRSLIARSISALLLVLAVVAPVAADDLVAVPEPAWESVDEADGIAVFRRDVPGSPLVAFKGVTTIEASIDKVLWVLVDNEHKTEWVDMCTESRVLERISDHEVVIYQRFSLPWYLSDRDYVYRARAVPEEHGAIRLVMSSCEHAAAPATVGVRGRLVESCYLLTPLGDNRTRVSVEIQTDPCGMVPDTLVNLVQREWPLKTLRGVRRQCRQAYCGRYPLPQAAPANGG
jgi:hypothetical protein